MNPISSAANARIGEAANLAAKPKTRPEGTDLNEFDLGRSGAVAPMVAT
jgi:hypothetical protein